MTWKLLVVMVCLTAHSAQAEDVELITDAFRVIGAILHLLDNLGIQGSTGRGTSSGRAECTRPENTTEVCDYYKETEACSKLVGCGTCKKSGTQSDLKCYCAAGCTEFKNDIYKNGKRPVCRNSSPTGSWN
ncbi:hypothetical protein HDE_06919 [Halotydeus destructor]|nr:hypothetical protein HDE_06919 [Halotydeus destructor]